MTAHWLVRIHRVQARRVEASQPHVAHDHHAERILAVFESGRQFAAAELVADMRLPVRTVFGAARHDDLHHAGLFPFGFRFVILGTGPVGAELDDGVIDVHADAAAHADDHCLAIHRFQAALVVLHEVGGDERNAFGIADQRLNRGPFGFELLFFVLFLSLGDFVELLVNLRQFGLIQR